ncbi:MAG: glycoside hydrolase superfamily [Monoraphidium minutum]|nr:MAG: glycoside hydrolase superfamily [Monoraphidium minutum]
MERPQARGCCQRQPGPRRRPGRAASPGPRAPPVPAPPLRARRAAPWPLLPLLLLLFGAQWRARAQAVPAAQLLAAGEFEVATGGAARDTFQATMSPANTTAPIRQILGVSLEWRRLRDWAPERMGRVFQQLGPAPVVRIGGLSTEQLHSLPPPSSWRALRAIAAASRAKFIVNLKLSGGNVNFTRRLHTRAARELGGSLLAFELGNEPRWWPGVPAVGGYTPGRKFVEGFEAFQDYYFRVARLLAKANPRVPILGPSWHHFSKDWTPAQIRGFVKAGKGANLREVAAHWYPPYAKATFKTPQMLSEGALRQAADQFRALAAAAAPAAVRITEANSMFHCGAANMSDTFAAALWSADFAFEMAAAGATGLNLHWATAGQPGNTSSFFWPCYYQGVEAGYRRAPDGARETFPVAKPPWGGYLLFARATLPGPGDGPAALARVESASASGSCGAVKLWPLAFPHANTRPGAGGGGGGAAALRIVLLNKRAAGACRVVLRVAGGGNSSGNSSGGGGARYGDASLQFLLPGGGFTAAQLARLAAGEGCSAAGGCGPGAAYASGPGLGARGTATLGSQAMGKEGLLQPPSPAAVPIAAAAAGGGGGGSGGRAF